MQHLIQKADFGCDEPQDSTLLPCTSKCKLWKPVRNSKELTTVLTALGPGDTSIPSYRIVLLFHIPMSKINSSHSPFRF